VLSEELMSTELHLVSEFFERVVSHRFCPPFCVCERMHRKSFFLLITRCSAHCQPAVYLHACPARTNVYLR
jgi:hypothetical protein